MLDKTQKIVDIILKGFATTLLAIGTYILAVQRLDFDRSGFCANFVQQSFEFVQDRAFTDAGKSMLDFRIQRHNSVCGPLEPDYVLALNNAWRPPTTIGEAQGGPPVSVAQPTNPSNPSNPDSPRPPPNAAQPLEVERNLDRAQWVAISRKSDGSYSAVNFDVVRGSDPPHRPDNIIRARWFVNIREANTPVVRGDNRVIGQILGGQCVRILQHVSGTLNEWARVERVTCPA